MVWVSEFHLGTRKAAGCQGTGGYWGTERSQGKSLETVEKCLPVSKLKNGTEINEKEQSQNHKTPADRAVEAKSQRREAASSILSSRIFSRGPQV